MLELAHHIEGEPLVDHHARVTEGETVHIEGRDLHRVLEEARPGREPRAGHIGCSRVSVGDRTTDALEVEAAVVGDHEELIGGRELDVPPGVGEELCQLRLLRRELDDVVGEAAEECGGALDGDLVTPRHDLGE